MPDAIVKAYGYHIYFWSNEGEPLEPIHIHISSQPHPGATKYWILEDGTLMQENNNDNIPSNDLKRLIRYITLDENIDAIKRRWLEHFSEITYYRQ